jgi:hypothetical protein
MDSLGYINWDEQLLLDKYYIEHTSQFSFEEIMAYHNRIMKIPTDYGIISLYSKEQRIGKQDE